MTGSNISQRESLSFEEPLSEDETQVWNEIADRFNSGFSLEDYLGRIVDWANRVFVKADMPTYSLGKLPEYEQAAEDQWVTEEWFAVELVIWVHYLRLSISRSDEEGLIKMALHLGELFKEAKINFEWGEDAVGGRRSRLGGAKNLEKGRKPKFPQEFWEQFRRKHERLVSHGHSHDRAIDIQLERLGKERLFEELPSKGTCKKYLGLTVDRGRFERYFRQAQGRGCDRQVAIESACERLAEQRFKVPSPAQIKSWIK